MKRLIGLLLVPLALAAEPPLDSRLGPPKTLNSYFPFTPPTSRAQWEARRQAVREQVLLANGLWPLPPRTPLNATIHGKIERDGYTIEKVFFASYPGHYVTGNLYRPKPANGRQPPGGKWAGVLSPHGHWGGNRSVPERLGRFFEASDAEVKSQMDQGAERTAEGARYPLQARCAQLARMGCVVFHHDMVGYADSTQIYHPFSKQNPHGGFADAEGELRLQSFMGLQTWNCVRALDFLLSLPDVDPDRIGVTGSSGGGTQTFILCAIDDRPAVAFPAVMVSTAMQGGCICENCSYLRVGTGNVEFAGLFAPKPLGMTGADDWTKEIETKGLPELKALYRLYDAEDRVMAKALTQFKHNYNQVSREVMYNWFNKHLRLGLPEPVVEQPFVPVPPKQLSVFDAEHPLPRDAVGVERLRQTITELSDRQMAPLQGFKDAAGLKQFRHTIGAALRVMVQDALPPADQVEAEITRRSTGNPIEGTRLVLGRKGQGERVPARLYEPRDPDGTVIVWISPRGSDELERQTERLTQMLNRKQRVLSVDVMGSPAFPVKLPPDVDARYAGYTFGYNRTLLANRVHDILTAVAYARQLPGTREVHLVGTGAAGPWVVLARGLCGDAVARTAADLHGFRFEQVKETNDEMMLPGALKYGGLPAFAALSAPGELFLHNTDGAGLGDLVQRAYQAAGQPNRLRTEAKQVSAEKVIDWLLAK